MVDAILLILFVLGIYIGLPILILWLRDKMEAKRNRLSPQEVEKRRRRYQERLLNPDFDALERYYGHPLPRAIKDLYEDQEELFRQDFKVAESTDTHELDRYTILRYHPADMESLSEAWSGCEEYFAFASDSLGNTYMIKPDCDDPAVVGFSLGGRVFHLSDGDMCFAGDVEV
ncbi:MAG: hypothetical protein GY869_28600 [Planctomycetes bacterium]|nr:hypothetical protein [Planctomycetota bacterium]